MKSRILFIAIIFTGVCFINQLEAQTSYAKENLETLSKDGLSAAWANRTIIDIYFDKENLVTNGLLDTSDRNYLLNSIFPAQQYQRSKRFVDIILDGALDGTFKVFDYTTEMPMPHAELLQTYSHTDSVRIPIPSPPYERDTVEKYVLNRDHILKYHVMIDWIFDAKKGTLKSKVLGIAPCLSKYNWDGTLRGYYPLFWICF